MAVNPTSEPAQAARALLIPVHALDAKRTEIDAIFTSFMDFPKKGINFVDIFPLFKNPSQLKFMISAMAEQCKALGAEAIVGIESRGFVFGTLLAMELMVPFVPVRKAGKLPGEKVKLAYGLEYATAEVEMQNGCLPAGCKTVICDDLLATGGTLAAACQLCSLIGLDTLAAIVVIELEELAGARAIPVPVYCFIKR